MIINSNYSNIIFSKKDYSTYLYHYTDHDSLKSILESGVLKCGFDGTISFTETPIAIMKPIMKLIDKIKGMNFHPYGIAIRKTDLYRKGARPVFYCTKDEYAIIPDSQKWRSVYSNLTEYDVCWQREWRYKGNIKLTRDNCVVFVQKEEELRYLFSKNSNIVIDNNEAFQEHERLYYGDTYENLNDELDVSSVDLVQDGNKVLRISLGVYK